MLLILIKFRVMSILKNIRLFYSMDRSQMNKFIESDYENYYDKFLKELELLIDDNNQESIYIQLNYIKIELICLKEFWKSEEDFRLFYLTKLVYIVDTYIQIVMWKISGTHSIQKNNFINDLIRWTGSVTEFVEMGYALIHSKRVNNGNIEIKFFISQLSLFFNFEVSDCFNIFREIRKRKYDRTAFLDELREGLIRRMDNLDVRPQTYKSSKR